MGGDESKENNKNNINNRRNIFTENKINLTNNLLIGFSKKDPSKDYKKLEFLGEDTFAEVYKVQNRISDAVRAMKVLNKIRTLKSKDNNKEEILNDYFILKEMDHPNIIKVFELYSVQNSYSIITEFCSEGELYQEIHEKSPFNEKYCAYIMYQILSAVNYFHKRNIVHRDIKPENILIAGRNTYGFPEIKIGDFCNSKICGRNDVLNDVVGSSYYIAPEVIKKKYNKKCDIWSCGVILYILLSGRPPFEGDTDNEIIEKITTEKINLNINQFNKVSSSAKDLIQKMLDKDPEKRIDAEEALSHKWFTQNNSQVLYNRINDENIIKNLIHNLKTYKKDSVLQETALAFLVHNFPQMNEVVNACKLFNQIDTDSDGKISQDDFLQGLKKFVKSETLEKDIDTIYKNIDMNNNGYLEYEEFVRCAIDKERLLSENILKFAFKYFDKDNLGEITFDQISRVFSEGIENKSKVNENLFYIINEVDEDHDGKISFQEFCLAMNKMIK